VNLVLARDVRHVKRLSNGGDVCQALLKKICPCATSSILEQSHLVDEYIAQYQKAFFKLIHSGRYDARDDFTVVIQPFLAKMELPLTGDDNIDFSYFAPDCFHFSGK
jgi:phospholipase B1, membrane-associated